MQYQKLVGIIVNRREVGEGDRFFTILTREEGKLSVYGRSVRSVKSKRAASLDLFSKIRFGLVKRGLRQTLTHVELLDSFRADKKKLSDISRLFVLGELIDTLLPENDPHPAVYDLLMTALSHLSRFATPEYLYRFKRKLLHLLGYGDRPLPPQELDAYIESLLGRALKTGQIL